MSKRLHPIGEAQVKVVKVAKPESGKTTLIFKGTSGDFDPIPRTFKDDSETAQEFSRALGQKDTLKFQEALGMKIRVEIGEARNPKFRNICRILYSTSPMGSNSSKQVGGNDPEGEPQC